jgi:hypothetical protein
VRARRRDASRGTRSVGAQRRRGIGEPMSRYGSSVDTSREDETP